MSTARETEPAPRPSARGDGARRRRIAIVGGRERSVTDLERVARQEGYELCYHPGHMSGRGSDEIRSLVSRCDVVVIVTEINSHGAMWVAKDAARSAGREAVVVRKASASALRSVLVARAAA